MSTLERMPFLAKNAVFKKLSEIADIRTLTHAEREKYDESLRIMRDSIASFKGALKQGEARGVRKNKIETAKKLLSFGVSEDIVKETTGLSKDELDNLDIEQAKLMKEDEATDAEIMGTSCIDEEEQDK